MQNAEYTIVLTTQARKLLQDIKDKREQQLILRRLETLKVEPEKQGKALIQELKGYRSIRAVGQRYRIIYRVEQDKVVVVVVAIGRRKEGDKNDIYEVMQGLLSQITQNEEE